MNKILPPGILSLFLAFGVWAQSATTLTKNNVPLLPGKVHYSFASVKGLLLPKTGNKIAWDYSKLKEDSTLTENYVSKIHNPFTKSNTVIIDTEKREFLVSNRYIHEFNFYDEDNKGWFFAGSYVSPEIISTQSFFNDSSDNIIVFDQNDSVRINLINFPDSIGKSYHAEAVKKLHFLWSVKSANMDTAQSVKKTYYSITDTTVGEGTLRIPTPKIRSIAYPVIQIRRKFIAVDSYLVNNKSPNKYFLLAFGIAQGKKTVECNEYFYKAGRQSPMMVIGFGSDTTFTTPVSVRYSTDSITPAPPVSIDPENEETINFLLFPNPANTGSINCVFSKPTAGNWKLIVSNMLGQISHFENISGVGTMDISLNVNMLSKGMYFANIIDDQGRIAATGKIVIQK